MVSSLEVVLGIVLGLVAMGCFVVAGVLGVAIHKLNVARLRLLDEQEAQRTALLERLHGYPVQTTSAADIDEIPVHESPIRAPLYETADWRLEAGDMIELGAPKGLRDG